MEDLQAYYGQDQEEDRLLARFVAPGSRVADVGGTGRYAEWAEGLCCEVDLLDPVDLHDDAIFRNAWFNGLEARLDDPTARARLLELAERLESDPNVLALSPHLLAVGVVP